MSNRKAEIQSGLVEHSDSSDLGGISLPAFFLASVGALALIGSAGCSDQTIASLPTNEAPAFLQDARNSFNRGRSIEEVTMQYDSAQEFIVKKFGQSSMENALLEIEVGNVLGHYEKYDQAIERLSRADNLLQNLNPNQHDSLADLRLRTLGALAEQYENNSQPAEATAVKSRAIKLREELYK